MDKRMVREPLNKAAIGDNLNSIKEMIDARIEERKEHNLVIEEKRVIVGDIDNEIKMLQEKAQVILGLRAERSERVEHSDEEDDEEEDDKEKKEEERK